MKKSTSSRKTPKAGPFLNTARARKTPGKSVKVEGIIVIKGKNGQKPLVHKKGALHAQLGVPQDKPIPAAKKEAALAGKYGELAKKRAVYAFKGALAAGRKTAAANKTKKSGSKKK
jgi:hypothetical protein